ncbi:MAG: hypothetical protein ACREID_04470, partial [Planctomycetota bacterium]
MTCTVVILTKLPGHLPVKTRLWAAIGQGEATRLYDRMLRATVSLARRFADRPVVAYSPPDAPPPDLPGCDFLPLRGADGSSCLEEAIARAFSGP